MLKSWDFASVLGHTHMSVRLGTWDLGPHVNRPLV